jgi:hypothetical protein
VDRALGVRSGAKWTGGVERKATYAGALSPFADASEVLSELAGLEMGSSEVDRIAQLHGERIDRLQRAQEAEFLAPVDPLYEPPEPALRCERQVVEADATCVLTVAGEEHKSVYCGTVFDLDARGRSETGRHFITNRLYTGSAEDMEDFGERLKALAWRGGMRGARETAFVGDGARCLWNWAEENLPPGTVFIQDFWHVCEHLAALAQLLFGELWQARFTQWKQWLRTSKLGRILKEIRRERQERRGKTREFLDAEMNYLEAGRARMDYARFEREGWPIGSGAIEATCKHLVKERFCVTGARWRRGNIPKMLALRIAIFNQEWKEYWEAERAA